MLRKEWAGRLQGPDRTGFYFSGAVFSVGASLGFSSPGRVIPCTSDDDSVSLILTDSHFLSLCIDLLSLALVGVGFRPLASIRPTVWDEAEYTSGRRGVAQGFRRNLSGA